MPDEQFCLTTERLALRRFVSADLDWIAALCRDPGVTRYVGRPKDRAGVEKLMNGRILQ